MNYDKFKNMYVFIFINLHIYYYTPTFFIFYKFMVIDIVSLYVIKYLSLKITIDIVVVINSCKNVRELFYAIFVSLLVHDTGIVKNFLPRAID